MKADKAINPSRQNLVAEYQKCCRSVRLLIHEEEAKKDAESEHHLCILRSCQGQLEEMDALLSKRWANITLVWRLLHWVHGQLILVMSPEELAARGKNLLKDLNLVALPEAVRTAYIMDVSERLKELEDKQHQSSDVSVAETAHLFKTVLNTINDFVDDLFWDIWVRRYFAFIYTTLLIILGLTFFLGNSDGQICLSVSNIIIIGAAGGLTSGIITSEQEYMSKGHFWLPTVYYMFVRPTIGIVAAVVMFWMLESHYLIQVDPPLQNSCAEIRGVPATPTAPSKSSAPGPTSAPLAKVSESAGVREKNDSSIVTLKSVEGKQVYLYMLLLFFAGFSGDKVLKWVSCRVANRLFAEAEKTKEAR